MTPITRTLKIYNKLARRIIFLKGKLTAQKTKFRNYSYAQSGEDRIVDFIFNRIGVIKPTYIDIGAHHPYYLSNTALFYGKGCRGINIEPDPKLFTQFPIHRKKDINLNCGVGKNDGALVLNIMNVPALNTFSIEEAMRLEKEDGFSMVEQRTIPVQKINTILKKCNDGVFPDFLSLDVEGFDEDIIKSIDFNQSRPTVICLETISYSANGRGQKNNAIIDYLQKQGYLLYADTNINSIFVLQEKWVRE